MSDNEWRSYWMGPLSAIAGLVIADLLVLFVFLVMAIAEKIS